MRALVARVSKALYDRVYRDPWLLLVFRVVKQEHIESQQTDFMVGAFGGPKNYSGRSPADAHPHIFIDKEMWALRRRYLLEAFDEAGVPEEMRDRWLKIEDAFKRAIVKGSPADCTGRFFTDEIISHLNPGRKL